MNQNKPTNESLLAEYALSPTPAILAQLYTLNRPLMYRWLKPYENHKNPMDDLLQNAYFGLLRAAQSYDASKGYKFTTYLYWYILSTARMRDTSRDALSLDEPLKEDSTTPLYAVIADADIEPTEDAIEREDTAVQVRRAVDRLEQRYRDIIHTRYFEGVPLTRAAKNCGLSPERVRQLESKALRKLRADKSLMAYKVVRHKSLASFRRDWTSSTEAAVILLDEEERERRMRSVETLIANADTPARMRQILERYREYLEF